LIIDQVSVHGAQEPRRESVENRGIETVLTQIDKMVKYIQQVNTVQENAT